MERILEKFMEENRIFRFEGDRGVENFEKIVQALGYTPHPFARGHIIEVFLADNPGAIEAMIEWIKDQRSAEWKESLENAMEE